MRQLRQIAHGGRQVVEQAAQAAARNALQAAASSGGTAGTAATVTGTGSTWTNARTLRVGDPLEAGVDIGPVASGDQLGTNLSYIRAGHEDGGELLAGGEMVERKTQGHFLAPTLFSAGPDDRIVREEIFGPVAAVLRADDYEQALALANDTEFGLCAGICTTSLKYATHFKRHAQAGMVMVNLPTAGVDPHVPFGGRKASSYGPREQGRYAVEFYTTVKTAYTAA